MTNCLDHPGPSPSLVFSPHGTQVTLVSLSHLASPFFFIQSESGVPFCALSSTSFRSSAASPFKPTHTPPPVVKHRFTYNSFFFFFAFFQTTRLTCALRFRKPSDRSFGLASLASHHPPPSCLSKLKSKLGQQLSTFTTLKTLTRLWASLR